MLCRDFILSDACESCLFLFAQLIVPYQSDGLALVNAGFLKTSDDWKAQLFSDGGANLSDALGNAGPMVQGVLRSFLTQTIYDFSEKP